MAEGFYFITPNLQNVLFGVISLTDMNTLPQSIIDWFTEKPLSERNEDEWSNFEQCWMVEIPKHLRTPDQQVALEDRLLRYCPEYGPEAEAINLDMEVSKNIGKIIDRILELMDKDQQRRLIRSLINQTFEKGSTHGFELAQLP
jgi:hypothetical protein